ncbi:radical SAM protein [bacterium]|nr:radical SAM protein [candidate division CSSED10-310 bacterium]
MYCQLGRMKNLQVDRESFFPKQDILAEILDAVRTSNPDCITFTGDGEPTLCRDIGWLIVQIKLNSQIPVAVITNGSLIHRKDVRQDLKKSDIIIPSLDAGNEKVFWKTNRPHPGIDYHRLVMGLKALRFEFCGELFLDVMLVKGVNDTKEALGELKSAIEAIKPDKVFFQTPTRPPAESWVEVPGRSTLSYVKNLFPYSVLYDDVESEQVEMNECLTAKQAIVNICSRHPLLFEQAVEIERRLSSSGTIRQLIDEGVLKKMKYHHHSFLLLDFGHQTMSEEERVI